MKVYFSGISGTGIGPLAELAQDAGYEICGSDLHRGAIADEMDARGVEVFYGEQDGKFLKKCHEASNIDWFVYTSALPKDHPELKLAQELGIHCSKRDEFLAALVSDKNLKMVAVAGTHGKTTTTSMLVWAFEQLGIPVSYLVGTTLPWGNGGRFDPKSEFFIYEADEYDRNFLAFEPFVGAITTIDYDHPDIYPTREDYREAFRQFEEQCQNVVWGETSAMENERAVEDVVGAKENGSVIENGEGVVKNTTVLDGIELVGELRRIDASLAVRVFEKVREISRNSKGAKRASREAEKAERRELVEVINRFPGAGRRFEEIAQNIVSDYGHHPAEIKLTVEMGAELRDKRGASGLAVIYQPHQNTRQHEVKDEYREVFRGADKVFWLPTFLTREDESLRVIEPDELVAGLANREVAEVAEMNDDLVDSLAKLHREGWIILLLSAGPADTWLRKVTKRICED